MRGRSLGRRCCLLVGGLMIRVWAMAQTADGNTGFSQANTIVRGYHDTATNLTFAIGALLGMVGEIRVFSMWIKGDERMGDTAPMWFGACVFLVVVATVIKSFLDCNAMGMATIFQINKGINRPAGLSSSGD